MIKYAREGGKRTDEEMSCTRCQRTLKLKIGLIMLFCYSDGDTMRIQIYLFPTLSSHHWEFEDSCSLGYKPGERFYPNILDVAGKNKIENMKSVTVKFILLVLMSFSLLCHSDMLILVVLKLSC